MESSLDNSPGEVLPISTPDQLAGEALAVTAISEAPLLPAREPMLVRLERKLADPVTLDTICAHVAHGGTLIEWCESLELRYGDITNWIAKDPLRKARMDRAILDRAEWLEERLMQEIRAIALVNIKDFYDPISGDLLEPHKWPDHCARAVASFEVTEEFSGKGQNREHIGYLKKIRLVDKLKALELHVRQLGMLNDKVEIPGLTDIANEMKKARERVLTKDGEK